MTDKQKIIFEDNIFIYNKVHAGVNINEIITKTEKVTIPDKIEGLPVISLHGTMSQQSNVKNLCFGENIKSIDSFFRNTSFIENIYINKNLEEIGEYAFSGCLDLVQVIFPEESDLTFLHKGAFKECISLKEIIIPKNVTFIGEYCFANCTSLQNIVFPEHTHILLKETLAYTGKLKQVTIPKNVMSIDKYFCVGSGISEITLLSDEIQFEIGSLSFTKPLSIILSGDTSLDSFLSYHPSNKALLDRETISISVFKSTPFEFSELCTNIL